MANGTDAYFAGGGTGEKVLRFLNLLEPGLMSLSLTNILMWVAIGCIPVAVAVSPFGAGMAISAAGGIIAATLNYGHQQYLRAKYPRPPSN